MEMNNKKKTKGTSNDKVTWELKSEDEALKCFVDENKQINVMIINSLNLEASENIFFACLNRFYTNYYKIVIITSQLWEGENVYSYNVPEFTIEPVRQSVRNLSKIISRPVGRADFAGE